MQVSFPWYEVPGSEQLYDELWTQLRAHLLSEDFADEDLPLKLNRALSHDDFLKRSDLLLTQTCGYDIAEERPLPWTLIGTWGYGDRPGTYTSYVVVREDSLVTMLDQANGRRMIANGSRSYSGYHVWRSLLGVPPADVFSETQWSGGHVESLRALQISQADIAAIDTVTWELLQKFAPDFLEGLRRVAESAPVPAPPLIASKSLSEEKIKRLKSALRRLFHDPNSYKICRELLITGFYEWRIEDYTATGSVSL